MNIEIEELDDGNLLLKNVEIEIYIQHNEKGKYGWADMTDDYKLHETLTLDLVTKQSSSWNYVYTEPKDLILKLSHKYRIKKNYISTNSNYYQKYKNYNIYYTHRVNINLNDKYYYRWLERIRERLINQIIT